MISAVKKINLLDLTINDLSNFFESIGEASYRTDQFLKWIHQNGVVLSLIHI